MADKLTAEQIANVVRVAGDSVWVIDQAIAKINEGAELSLSLKGDLQRNVEHLKIVTTNADVVESGADVSSLTDGIARGEARLAEGTWPAEPAHRAAL